MAFRAAVNFHRGKPYEKAWSLYAVYILSCPALPDRIRR